jgi:integrating conjugative element protein (TIGR03755 family)
MLKAIAMHNNQRSVMDRRMRLSRILIGCFILSFMSKAAYADLIPAADSPWYYKLGGGQSVASPAYRGAYTVPLHVEGDVGLGYNCGVFNPKLSITNSLNAIQNSFQSIQHSIVEHATSAITELPMYAISRADPALYHLLNNALLGAREDLNVSMKTCQQMQSEMSKGQNPYHDWMSLSLGNDWQYHMSLAAEDKNGSNSDMNHVKNTIEQANGDKGVPWVHGVLIGRKGFYAGGKGQPPILVLHDTAIAGYNVILQTGRDYDEPHAPVRTEDNAHLVDTWVNPIVAAQWISNVLGDEKITTYLDGDKQSSPGVGLLPDNQLLTQQLIPKLQNLVNAKQPLSIEHLKEVSAPGVMLNTAVIYAIRQKPPVTQAIVINKLAQEVATANVLDKALLARQILQEGSQVPAIHANKAAQTTINQALLRLDQAMNNLLFNAQVRKAFVSETAAQLLQTNTAEQLANASIRSSITPPLMQQGALKTENKRR